MEALAQVEAYLSKAVAQAFAQAGPST